MNRGSGISQINTILALQHGIDGGKEVEDVDQVVGKVGDIVLEVIVAARNMSMTASSSPSSTVRRARAIASTRAYS